MTSSKIAVYYGNQLKLCGQNVELLNFKTSGIYEYHRSLTYKSY